MMVELIVPDSSFGVFGRMPPLEFQTRIRRINGLVHPFTGDFSTPNELNAKFAEYNGFVGETIAKPDAVMVFVGTASPDTVEKLRQLEPTLARRLSEGLPDLSDGERDALKQQLKARGVYIMSNARYGFLEELSVLHKAATGLSPGRLVYYESSIDQADISSSLSRRIDAVSVDVVFRGEKTDVCVKDQAGFLCNALNISRGRLKIV
ncbi:MAG: hypothetical protein ABIH11_03955 [Candidatus Altiarchaeota archaeon]